jgi:hypothetical protein
MRVATHFNPYMGTCWRPRVPAVYQQSPGLYAGIAALGLCCRRVPAPGQAKNRYCSQAPAFVDYQEGIGLKVYVSGSDRVLGRDTGDDKGTRL